MVHVKVNVGKLKCCCAVQRNNCVLSSDTLIYDKAV